MSLVKEKLSRLARRQRCIDSVANMQKRMAEHEGKDEEVKKKFSQVPNYCTKEIAKHAAEIGSIEAEIAEAEAIKFEPWNP